MQKPSLTLLNSAAVAILLVLAVYTLSIGKALLLPFTCALVIWYITIQFTELLQNTLRINQYRLPFSIAVMLAVFITIFIIYQFFVMFSHSLVSIISQAQTYQAKIQTLLNWISEKSHSKLELQNLLSRIDIPSLLSSLAVSLTSLAANIALILIYVIFMVIEYKIFHDKLMRVLKNKETASAVEATLVKIRKDINTYVRIKTWMSVLLAVITYVLLTAIGIENAQFWALLTFLLNYIPNIGPIIAVLLCVLAISITGTSISVLLGIGFLLTCVHFISGNFLEPRLMGASLGLSPLVILISLSFWGQIWGLIGIFLCVPLMNIISIILDKFPKTRPIAILMSGG